MRKFLSRTLFNKSTASHYVDDDEKNSELIARLLMQDQMQDAGFDDNPYLFGEEDQDDDFVPIGVIQKAKRRGNLIHIVFTITIIISKSERSQRKRNKA
jgi:hypothetical protein